MSEQLARYTLRLPRTDLDKLQYISKYECRTANKQIEKMIKDLIRDFEQKHGEITPELIQELYNGI